MKAQVCYSEHMNEGEPKSSDARNNNRMDTEGSFPCTLKVADVDIELEFLV